MPYSSLIYTISHNPETTSPDNLEDSKIELKKPSMYKVILLNDDFTPMEFVVDILTGIFHLSNNQAIDIMMHVHQKGYGIAGLYTFEIAETKVMQVLQAAKKNQHPLKCRTEKD